MPSHLCQPCNICRDLPNVSSAPPVASLRELEAVAKEITAKRLDDLDALRRWLAVLVVPGASLGGARPKANFTDTDQSLWIANFPAKDDERDVGAWASLVHGLAQRTGIEVPPARTKTFGGEFHTFCLKRFDRVGNWRRFYASAMAMLRKDQSEGTSSLDMAEFLHHRGAKQYVEADLEQLFGALPSMSLLEIGMITCETTASF
jgi:serine/threonine-protein kinase HipA